MSLQPRHHGSLCFASYLIHLVGTLILLVGLVLPVSFAQAQGSITRYVDPVNGSDNHNDCDAEHNPCKSIQYAISVSSSGDTIDLAAGTYFEHIVIDRDLTITYSGPSRCLPSTICSATLNGSRTGRVVQVEWSRVVTLSNMTIRNGMLTEFGSSGAGIYNLGILKLDRVTLYQNIASDAGGAIYNNGILQVENSILHENTANNGGGIASYGVEVSITNTSIYDNLAMNYGGGLFVVGAPAHLNQATIQYNRAADRGGGIFANTSDFQMVNSILYNNQAIDWNETYGSGGGIYLYGNFRLTNVTMTGNKAATGGAFILDDTADGNFNHVTIAGNDTHPSSPEIPIYSGGSLGSAILRVYNSILVDSATGVPTCAFSKESIVATLGPNLITDTSCVGTAGNILTTDPRLGALADHGGPTQTMALLSGSPALDAAKPVSPDVDPLLDQRGFARQTPADIGAYERLAPVSVSATFPTGSVAVDQPVDLVISLANHNHSPAPLSNLSFTLVLPDGLEIIGAPAEPANPCGGFLDATPGGTTISLTNGYLEAAAHPPASCEIRVQVKASTAGDYLLTVPGVTAYEVEAGEDARASLVVRHKVYIPVTRRP